MSLLSHKLCRLVVMGFYAYSIKDLLKKKPRKCCSSPTLPEGHPLTWVSGLEVRD